MRTIKGNQESPFTPEDILWQLCNNDVVLFDAIKDQIRVEDQLATETDEVYMQRLLDRAVTLEGILQNHVSVSAVSDIRPGKALYEHTPIMPAGVLAEAGVEMSFAE